MVFRDGADITYAHPDPLLSMWLQISYVFSKVIFRVLFSITLVISAAYIISFFCYLYHHRYILYISYIIEVPSTVGCWCVWSGVPRWGPPLSSRARLHGSPLALFCRTVPVLAIMWVTFLAWPIMPKFPPFLLILLDPWNYIAFHTFFIEFRCIWLLKSGLKSMKRSVGPTFDASNTHWPIFRCFLLHMTFILFGGLRCIVVPTHVLWLYIHRFIVYMRFYV